MSKFILNVSDILSGTNDTKKKITDYRETMNIYMKNVSNFDTVWNDNNTIPFVDIVKKDQVQFNDYIDSLNSYLDVISNFCNALKQIIKSNLKINLTKIDYNFETLNSVILRLKKIYQKLNDNYKILRYMRVSPTADYYLKIQKFKTNTLNYRNTVNDLLEKLTKVRDDIENLVSSTKKTVNGFEIKAISGDPLSHVYKVSSSNMISSRENKVISNVNVISNFTTPNLVTNNTTPEITEVNHLGVQIARNDLQDSDYDIKMQQQNYGGINISRDDLQNSDYNIAMNQLNKTNSQIQRVQISDSNNEVNVQTVNSSNSVIDLNSTASQYNSEIDEVSVAKNNINNLNFQDSNEIMIDTASTNNNIQSVSLSNTQPNLVEQSSVKNNVVNLNISNNH